MFQQIFYGLIMIVIGIVTLKYNFQIVNNTARLEWIESKLGAGSTFTFYKLFSVILVFVGILVLTGLGTPFFRWLLSPLDGIFTPLG